MLYMLEAEAERAAKLNRAECFPFRSVFIPFVCRTGWGAISAAALGCLHNSIELTVPRIEGVLRFWEALDTLKYIVLHQRPISLAEMMVYYFEGHVAMWVDQPTGNMRTDLQTAIEQMRHASAEEIHRRLVKRLREMVDTEKRLEHQEWLKSPGVIEAALEAERQIGQDWYDNLTGGQMSEHGGFLFHLDKKCPGAVP
jgi:hypothetical protein